MPVRLQYPIICLCMRCLSLISVFFTHPLHDVLARTRDNSKRRGQIPGPMSWRHFPPMWLDFSAQIISAPYWRPPTLIFCPSVQEGYSRSDVRVPAFTAYFPRMLRSLGATNLLGTKKANSVACVVAKPTPRLCNGVLAPP